MALSYIIPFLFLRQMFLQHFGPRLYAQLSVKWKRRPVRSPTVRSCSQFIQERIDTLITSQAEPDARKLACPRRDGRLGDTIFQMSGLHGGDGGSRITGHRISLLSRYFLQRKRCGSTFWALTYRKRHIFSVYAYLCGITQMIP